MWNLLEINKKDTGTTSVEIVLSLLTYNISDNIVSAVDFEQLNAGCDSILASSANTDLSIANWYD